VRRDLTFEWRLTWSVAQVLGSTTLWLWHMRCSVNHINNPDLFAPPLKMSIASERPDFVRPNDALTTSLPTHHYHQLHPANLTHYRICIPPSFSRLAPSSTFVIPATPHINHTPQANRNEYAPTLSSTVMGAFSRPAVRAPRFPMSVCTHPGLREKMICSGCSKWAYRAM